MLTAMAIAYVVDAVRSPIGRRNGSLSEIRADELAAQVLNGLVGRVDPAFDRRSRTLTINALHWEPGTRRTKALERRVRRAIEELGRFLSASEIVFASGPRRARAGP